MEFTEKTTIEWDYVFNCPTDCTDFQTKLMLRGDTSTSTNQSCINIQTGYNTTNQGYYLSVYVGGSVNQTHIIQSLDRSQTYKMKLVVDPVTHEFDLYVDGAAVLESKPFRSDLTTFKRIEISTAAKCSAGEDAKAYFDNFLVRKVATE